MFGTFDTAVLDHIQAVAYIRDKDHSICYVNPAAEKVLGLSRDELLGRKCWQVFGDVNHCCRTDCSVTRACDQGTTVGHVSWIMKNDQGREFEVSGSIIPLTADSPVQGVLVLLDNFPTGTVLSRQACNLDDNLAKEVEQRKVAEQLLRREKQMFVDGPVVILQWSSAPGWPVVYVSENIVQFGYRPEQLLSGEILFNRIVHEKDRERVLRDVRRYSRKKNASFSQEYRIVTAGGEVRWVYDSSRVIHDDEQGISHFYGYLIDTTEQKRNQEALRRSRNMLDKVLDTIPQAVFWKDHEGRFLGCNKVFAEAFDLEGPDALVGKTDYDLPIPEDIRNAYRADDMEVLSSNRPKYHIIEPLYSENGAQRWLDTSKAPLLDENDEPFAVLGVFEDITERKAMAEALERRVLALTMPLDDPDGIEFEDLFNLDDIQRLQDSFCKANGVAGLVVRPNGNPLTKPSCFSEFCRKLVRENPEGMARCVASDAEIGKLVGEGPVVRCCLSAGLWNGGAAIKVGGRHLASWMIGQVRDADLDVAHIRSFAQEIGADEEEMVRCFQDVPVMSKEQFDHVAEASFILTRYLSSLAYQNIQQARYITQRRQAEEALLKSREEMLESRLKLELALSIAQMGHWEGSMLNRLESGGSYFTFNDQFYEIYGTTAIREGGYEMTAQRYTEEFVHPEDAWMMSLELGQLLHKIDPDDYRQLEHRIVRRDGEVRHVLVRYKLLRNKQGEPIKTLGVNQDITDRKLVEEQLRRAKQDAEAASRAKSVFLANMSHEIRTPINGLMGMLQLMQGSNTQPEHEEYIDIAIRSSKRLTRLLSDILDISRVEAGKMQIATEPFNLRETLENLIQLFVPTAKAKSLSLSIKIDADIPDKLLGDTLRVQQVVANLIGNAVKFTLEGGVQVHVHAMPRTAPNQCRLLFCIADSGIGISDETFSRLFTPFGQDEERYRHQFGGAGLGLAITRQLTELMGGTIAAVSEEGEGSTFYLCLPFEIDGKRMKPETVEIQSEWHVRLSVLLAEDDAISRMVAEQLLVRSGFTVQAVDDGRQLLDALKNESFDMVIMDVQMPVLDGLETTRAIRAGEAGERNRNVPIIAMTACAMDEDKNTILEAGMNGYVEKPMELERLLKEIRTVLEGMDIAPPSAE